MTGDKVARGQITFIDANDAISINAFINSNQPLTQIYNKDTKAFTPDWTESPYLKLTPALYMSGNITDQMNTAGRIKNGSVKWYKDGTAIAANTSYTINSAAPYDLTIRVNDLAVSTQARYQFDAIFIDPNTKLEMPFSTTITLTKMENAGQLICAVAYAPDGTVFKNDQSATLRAHCDMWRGATIDNTDVSYKWGIKKNGVFVSTSANAAAANGAFNLTLKSIDNIIVGSRITVGSTQYTVTAVNSSTKAVGITPALTAAVTIDTPVSCPYYDTDLGENWAIINATNTWGGITGYTTDEITIPAGAVLNYETFKCVIKDTDSTSTTATKTVSDIISFADISDPISIDIAAPSGNILKNGQGTIQLTAKVWRAGAEIDASGTTYTYKWTRYNENGVLDTSFNQSAKTITVTSSHVNGKATFECELISK